MDTQLPQQGQWLADTRISDALPQGVLITDAEGYCLYSNPAFRELTRVSAVQVPGLHWLAFIDPRDRDRARECAEEPGTQDPSGGCQLRVLHSGEDTAWVRQEVTTLDQPGSAGRRLFTFQDITLEKAREQARLEYREWLYEECEQYRVTLDAIADGVLSADAHGAVTYMNDMAETLTGWSRWRALGCRANEVMPVLDAATRENARDPARLALERETAIKLSAEHILVRADGREITIEDSAAPIYNRDNTMTGAAVVFHDIRYSREMTDRMTHLARHDPLTGLANRMSLADRLSYSLALAERRDLRPAVLFIDVDNFKEINDRLGHVQGDQVLVSLARELMVGVRASDTVCRYGGDEFVVLLSEIRAPEDALAVARHLNSRLARPCRLDDCDTSVNVSIGISVFPDQGRDANALLDSADKAMYQAKRAGETIAFFRHPE